MEIVDVHFLCSSYRPLKGSIPRPGRRLESNVVSLVFVSFPFPIHTNELLSMEEGSELERTCSGSMEN